MDITTDRYRDRETGSHVFDRMVKQTGTKTDRQLGHTDRETDRQDKLLDRFVRQTGTETDRQVGWPSCS